MSRIAAEEISMTAIEAAARKSKKRKILVVSVLSRD